MAIRVVHWGTGDTGLAALVSILGHPELELAGVYVARPDRAGRDVGELLGIGPVGIATTNDLDELVAVEADVLSYFGRGVDERGPNPVIPFIEAGRNVVSTALPLVAPEFAPRGVREPIEAACVKGNASVFVTGCEPGVGTDLLPMTLLSLCDGVACIRMQEISNYSRYAVEPMMRFFGFGNAPDEPVRLFQGTFIPDLWSPIVKGMAAHLGVELDGIEVLTDTAIVDHDVETAWGVVPAGTVGGVRFQLVGTYAGEPLVVLEHVNFLDVDVPRLAGWPVGHLGRDTVYRTEISGRPRLVCELDLAYDAATRVEHGLAATASRAINAIPYVVQAPPGILGPIDVPVLPSGHILRPLAPTVENQSFR
jgi:4-hydroxy-tetrahydrodipicolinate reductase